LSLLVLGRRPGGAEGNHARLAPADATMNHILVWLLLSVLFAAFAVITEVTQWAG